MKSNTTIVLKLGSSILSSVECMPRAAHIIKNSVQHKCRVVAVVSALAGETDKLFDMAHKLDELVDPFDVAAFVSTGEIQSALLLSIALARVGIHTGVTLPIDVGLRANGPPLDSDPVAIDVGALRQLLFENQVVVLPGYVAVDEQARTVLLGRGGSDDSALFVAQQLGVHCRLLKDVDGIFEWDPALAGPKPRRFDTISWADALRYGIELVQPKAIRFAEAHNLAFEVSSLDSLRGTLVGAGPSRLQDMNSNDSHAPPSAFPTSKHDPVLT